VGALVGVGLGSLALGDLERGRAGRLSRSEVKRLWMDAGAVAAKERKRR
jgi:hypothetical protein